MRTAFADAYFYLALANRLDPAHHRAAKYAMSFPGTIVTTQLVLTEVADGVARSAQGRKWFVDFFARLTSGPSIHVVSASDALFRDALDLYARRPDKHWSLTDCASFVVMGRDGIADALTGDHHFEQAGFVALLK